MGALVRPLAGRAVLALAVAAVVAAPLRSLGAADELDAAANPVVRAAPVARVLQPAPMPPADTLDPNAPPPQHFNDDKSVLSFDPPPGWVPSPASALNPVSDPPEPVFEIARYQVRIGDPKLYETAVPITSGLVEDAVAVISVGIARADSELIGMSVRVRGEQAVGSVPGFVTYDEDATYEGVRSVTRYFISRDADRIVVFRAYVADADWASQSAAVFAAAASVRADPRGPNAPAAPPPPPPPPPAVIAPAPDPTAEIRSRILSRAASLLGLQYIWGGNSTRSGMDCSAFVSWAWSVDRYTTDSIWQVSSWIDKSELRPGDALNLTIGRDPRRFGHMRIFEAWANAEHSLMWVYEETPPHAVHRVIAYDDRYQPIRLSGLSGAGETKLIPGLPAPEQSFEPRRPSQPAPTRRPNNFVPAPRPTARPVPTVRPTPRPTATVAPRATAAPGGTLPPLRPGPMPPPRTAAPTPDR